MFSTSAGHTVFKRRQKAHQRVFLEEYPPDGWLKGYFFLHESDVRGGDVSSRRCWKNIDFLRLKDFALHLLEPMPPKRILDIGCGDGAMMVYCGLQGATVYGQDLDREQVAKANDYLKRFGLQGEARCGDARQMDYPDGFFDGAISGDFMEHVTDEVKVQILKEIKRCLKTGAPLVIKTPNLRYLKTALLYKKIGAILRLRNPGRFTIAHTPGTDHPQHIGLINRGRLTRCLLEAGFLNYRYHYAPLRRFGTSGFVEILSTDVLGLRDFLCEDLFCVTWKPIIMSHFPD